jgi:hypothetical protein
MLCKVKPESAAKKKIMASNTADEDMFIFMHVYRLLILFFSVTLAQFVHITNLITCVVVAGSSFRRAGMNHKSPPKICHNQHSPYAFMLFVSEMEEFGSILKL